MNSHKKRAVTITQILDKIIPDNSNIGASTKTNMNSEPLEWINAALKLIGSNSTPLAPNDASIIVAKAKTAFVQGNPRAWWMSLKGHVKIYDSQKEKLENVLPSSHDRYWFIPETDENILPIFELSLSEIKDVISQCPFFEYNILDKKLRWIVAESDHNQFHLVSLD